MNTIQDFWVNNHHFHKIISDMIVCPEVKCADGFTVSVQASRYFYSTPNAYMAEGCYTHWELGFPSEADALINEYAKDEDNLTDTVYGFVPTEIVNALIEKHGGLVEKIPSTY